MFINFEELVLVKFKALEAYKYPLSELKLYVIHRMEINMAIIYTLVMI